MVVGENLVVVGACVCVGGQRCQRLGLTDVVCAKKRRKGDTKRKKPLTLLTIKVIKWAKRWTD